MLNAVEVSSGLWVGGLDSCPKDRSDTYVVHACKDPCHRKLLGYTTRGAPKDSPDYLFAVRENDLYLNMIDTDKPEFISSTLIDEALVHIFNGLRHTESQVLVHCNHGFSRAPGIAYLYMRENELVGSEEAFRRLYPAFNPSPGMRAKIDSILRGDVE